MNHLTIYSFQINFSGAKHSTDILHNKHFIGNQTASGGEIGGCVLLFPRESECRLSAVVAELENLE
jgi:hypothetical protein